MSTAAASRVGADILDDRWRIPFERPPRARSAAGVAATIARLLVDIDEGTHPPPPWLRPDQRVPFLRLVTAVRRFGGAMLALPVGAGKTFVALGAAQALRPGTAVSVLAPAILRAQWQRAAERAGVPIRFTSHEAASRGIAPAEGGAVVIDESHRFRNPGTRRYHCVAPALAGKAVILVTGTPVVNRLADLGAQLALGVRDDALRFDGVSSIARAVAAPPLSPAFGRLIVTGMRPAGTPSSRHSTIRWDDPHLERAISWLDSLRLSRLPAVAALLRTTLLTAAASSPAALRAALGRYQRLLAHAAAARRAGRPVNRQLLRDMVAADPEQLLMWEVLEPMTGPGDLAVGDAPRTVSLIRSTRRWEAADHKRQRLAALLQDRTPTALFTSRVETVHYLRRALAGPGIAWLTGTGAGFGGGRASRAVVLAAFDPAGHFDPRVQRPWLLLASDVAAEGLNLQRVGRVIHYDLPWTAVRLDQRTGRAVRLGATFGAVEVVRFTVPEAIESRVAIEETLRRKTALPEQAGLSGIVLAAAGRAQELAERFGRAAAERGWTVVEGGIPVAGLVVEVGGNRMGWVLARGADGAWTEDRDRIEAALAAADATLQDPECEPRPRLAEVLDSLARAIADRLATVETAALLGRPVPLRTLAAAGMGNGADRLRRPAALQAEPLLRFLRRGHTAGESMIAARALRGEPDALERAAALGVAADDGPVRVRLAGLILPG